MPVEAIIDYQKTLFKIIETHYPAFVSIIIIAIGTKVALSFFGFLTKKLFIVKEGTDDYEAKLSRMKTLLPVVLSFQKYLIYFVAIVAVLGEFGIDTSAILASAGVMGLALGFGAQHLVKDIISGFFLLFDGLIKVGDVITVGTFTGEIERIDLRNTLVREFAGRLWAVPNGEIRTFGNFNRDFVRAVVEMPVAYEQDFNLGMEALRIVGEKWVSKNRDIVLEDPQVQAINSFGDSSVVIRIVIKLKPQKHWTAQRELMRLIKIQFDEMGVEIPFPRRVIYTRQEENEK